MVSIRYLWIACGVLTVCLFHSLDCKLSEGEPRGCFASQGMLSTALSLVHVRCAVLSLSA